VQNRGAPCARPAFLLPNVILLETKKQLTRSPGPLPPKSWKQKGFRAKFNAATVGSVDFLWRLDLSMTVLSLSLRSNIRQE
jgi:hypothetical protein